MIDSRRQFLFIILLALSLFVIGTIGYIWIEGWSVIDALYMTAITLSTVGYGETQPLSVNGRFFTIILIILGVGTVAYSLTQIGELIVTMRTTNTIRRRHMKRIISKLQNHIIVCGYGRVGRSAVTGLLDGRRQVVVIEKQEQKIQQVYDDGLLLVEGDATKDETLQEAGIDQAASILICTGDDTTNLFVVLSARTLNPNLYIVARAVDSENESKMRRVGANRVVSPYRIGGKHMANIIIRPHVTDFFDVVTLDNGMELWLEELIIADDSPLVGQTVGDAHIRGRTGVTLVAVLRRDGDQAVTPTADTTLKAGDELIVLGSRDQLASLEILTGDITNHVGT